MLSDKRFLTGLGTGLIIGALLLQLMNVAGAGREPSAPIDKIYSQEEADELVRQALNEASESDLEDDAAKDESTEAEDTAMPADDSEDVESRMDTDSTDLVEPDGEDALTLQVIIRYRMTAEEAADAAIEAGLLDDKDAFLQELIKRNLMYRLQVGTFNFDSMPTIPELVDALTSRPK